MTVLNRTAYLGHGFAQFWAELVRSRRLVLDLTKREFRGRYLGSAFGFVWAFIHPSVLMLIYWAVFKYALHAAPVQGVPFVVWLLTGLVPWFMAGDCIGASPSVITDNRFLVKKVVFRVSLLPAVRLLSLLPVHLFFIAAVTIIVWGYGYPPSWYTLQVFWYLGALLLASMGWAWLISALVPFLKDLGQVVQVLIQVLFWWTPLVWPISNIPDRLKPVMYLDPLYYVVEGYRESLVTHVPFWHHPLIGAYYGGVTLFLLAAGGTVFLRLRAHFADVL